MAWQIIVVEPALSWLHGLRRTDRQTLLWYRTAIPLAETAYADHLRRVEEKGVTGD
jgi:hypothetical protein